MYVPHFCSIIHIPKRLSKSKEGKKKERKKRKARRSNQSILKEISPEYSLEALILKLKLQYFGHLVQSQFTGKDPDAGKDGRQEEKGTIEKEMIGWHP